MDGIFLKNIFPPGNNSQKICEFIFRMLFFHYYYYKTTNIIVKLYFIITIFLANIGSFSDWLCLLWRLLQKTGSATLLR
jgi:hypothetical protein